MIPSPEAHQEIILLPNCDLRTGLRFIKLLKVTPEGKLIWTKACFQMHLDDLEVK